MMLLNPMAAATEEGTTASEGTFGTWDYDVMKRRFTPNRQARHILDLDRTANSFDLDTLVGRFHKQHEPAVRYLLSGRCDEDLLLTLRLRSDDGYAHYINLQAMASNVEGSQRSISGIVFESSGGRTMRLEIQSSNTRFDALARAMPTPFMYVTRDLKVEFVSKVLAESLGLQVRDILGEDVREVLGEQFERSREYWYRALKGETISYETEVTTFDGSKQYLLVNMGPVRDRDGEVKGIVSDASDVTRLRLLEAEARKGENAFRMLAEGVPNQLLFCNRNLEIEFANDAVHEASGMDRSSAIGKHLSFLIGKRSFERRKEEFKRVLSGESFSEEVQGAVGDPAGFYRMSYRPQFDSAGKVRGFYSMAVNITDRRIAELALQKKHTELARSNKDLEQFAYVASHDLKSPLRAIQLLVGWIKESLATFEDEEVHENLDLLEKRAQRLNRLLDDLLAYSRVGRKVGEFRETDIGELLGDVIGMMHAPAHIDLSVSGAMPKFKTYHAPLEQVFRNLIGNAIKHYQGDAGRVVVSCQEQGDFFLFLVEDNGTGIPQEYAEKVFQMFQTLQPRDSVEGSGMGLAIVSRIVNWQGGRVWFEPAPSGQGTVFKFQWPKRAVRRAESE